VSANTRERTGRDDTLQLLGAARPDPGEASRGGSDGIDHGLPRARHHRRRDAGCSDRWELGRPHAPGVRLARDADATCGSGPFTTPAPRSGLGIRPRSELQRGGGLRRLSPQEAPTRDPTLGDRRDLVGCLPSRSAAPCVYGRKGVVLAETARDPRGDWLLSRPSRAGAASPRPLAGKPAESNQLTDLAGSGWSTGRRLDRGRSASGERVIERAGPRRVGPFAFDDAVAQATRIVRSSSGDWPGWPRTTPPAARSLCIGHVSRSWSVIALSGRSRSM
jgi:hypothetical protein